MSQSQELALRVGLERPAQPSFLVSFARDSEVFHEEGIYLHSTGEQQGGDFIRTHFEYAVCVEVKFAHEEGEYSPVGGDAEAIAQGGDKRNAIALMLDVCWKDVLRGNGFAEIVGKHSEPCGRRGFQADSSVKAECDVNACIDFGMVLDFLRDAKQSGNFGQRVAEGTFCVQLEQEIPWLLSGEQGLEGVGVMFVGHVYSRGWSRGAFCGGAVSSIAVFVNRGVGYGEELLYLRGLFLRGTIDVRVGWRFPDTGAEGYCL